MNRRDAIKSIAASIAALTGVLNYLKPAKAQPLVESPQILTFKPEDKYLYSEPGKDLVVKFNGPLYNIGWFYKDRPSNGGINIRNEYNDNVLDLRICLDGFGWFKLAFPIEGNLIITLESGGPGVVGALVNPNF